MARQWRYCSNHAGFCEMRLILENGSELIGGAGMARKWHLQVGFVWRVIHRNVQVFLCKGLHCLLACWP
jgi:hypothetical protein